MANQTNARKRGRRITLEIPETLYARLQITKVQTRRSLSALAEEGLANVVDHYSAARRNEAAGTAATLAPSTPPKSE